VVTSSMTLPGFQGHRIFEVEYVKKKTARQLQLSFLCMIRSILYRSFRQWSP